MKPGEHLELVVRKKGRKHIPKKILLHEQLPISEKYSCQVSVWVADTPGSNYKPTVNLTLTHNGIKFRLCFNGAPELVLWIGALESFIAKHAPILHERQTEAILEFIDFHGEAIAPAFNNYTVNTVIQGKRGEKKVYEMPSIRENGFEIDPTTGEVLNCPKSPEQQTVH